MPKVLETKFQAELQSDLVELFMEEGDEYVGLTEALDKAMGSIRQGADSVTLTLTIVRTEDPEEELEEDEDEED